VAWFAGHVSSTSETSLARKPGSKKRDHKKVFIFIFNRNRPALSRAVFLYHFNLLLSVYSSPLYHRLLSEIETQSFLQPQTPQYEKDFRLYIGCICVVLGGRYYSWLGARLSLLTSQTKIKN
jgi:hypothetical protein